MLIEVTTENEPELMSGHIENQNFLTASHILLLTLHSTDSGRGFHLLGRSNIYLLLCLMQYSVNIRVDVPGTVLKTHFNFSQ